LVSISGSLPPWFQARVAAYRPNKVKWESGEGAPHDRVHSSHHERQAARRASRESSDAARRMRRARKKLKRVQAAPTVDTGQASSTAAPASGAGSAPVCGSTFSGGGVFGGAGATGSGQQLVTRYVKLYDLPMSSVEDELLLLAKSAACALFLRVLGVPTLCLVLGYIFTHTTMVSIWNAT
jgi:hypothetical protein